MINNYEANMIGKSKAIMKLYRGRYGGSSVQKRH